MKGRNTVLLILAFVVLAGAYVQMIHARKVTHREAVAAKRVFASLNSQDVNAIRIAQIDQKPVQGMRGPDGQWTITEPDSTVAASSPVWEHAAAGIAGIAAERVVEAKPTDLKPYELNEPRLVVTADTAKGQKISVRFGKMEPTQQYHYAQVDDGAVILVRDEFFSVLNRSLLDLRQRYIFAFDEKDKGFARLEFVRIRRTSANAETTQGPASTQGVAASEESVPVVLERADQAPWKMVKPIEAPADQEAVNDFARYVQFATALRYIEKPENLADYGLDPPAARISVWTTPDATPQTLFLGASEHAGKGGGIFARRSDSDTVFTIDEVILEKLPRSPEAFRERRMFSRDTNTLTRVHYQDPKESFTLVKDPTKGWQMTEPAATDTDQIAVSQYIGFLSSLDVMGFQDAPNPSFGLDPPSSKFTFGFSDGSESTLALGAATADGQAFYAMQDNGQIATLSAATGKILIRTAFDFRGKTIFTFKADDVRAVLLSLDGVDYGFEYAVGGWRVRVPEDKVWDAPSDMQALLEAINPLKAERQEVDTTPSDLSPYGLAAPTATLRIATLSPDGKQSAKIGPLSIGAPTPDDPRARFAMADGVPGVYRISQDTLDKIREALKGLRSR